MKKRSARIFAFIGALIAWFAVVAQVYLMITNRVIGIPETLFRFFSFFTINTNIIVALCFTFVFPGNKFRLARFFSKASTVTAITVYITVVGIVYNVILRGIWDPQGMQKLVDELLHSVIPAVFIIFWLIFIEIEELKWKMFFHGLFTR